MSDIRDRFNATMSRADRVIAESTRREIARLEAEDAERADAARAKARDHAERRRMIATKYDDAFASFSVANAASTG